MNLEKLAKHQNTKLFELFFDYIDNLTTEIDIIFHEQNVALNKREAFKLKILRAASFGINAEIVNILEDKVAERRIQERANLLRIQYGKKLQTFIDTVFPDNTK